MLQKRLRHGLEVVSSEVGSGLPIVFTEVETL